MFPIVPALSVKIFGLLSHRLLKVGNFVAAWYRYEFFCVLQLKFPKNFKVLVMEYPGRPSRSPVGSEGCPFITRTNGCTVANSMSRHLETIHGTMDVNDDLTKLWECFKGGHADTGMILKVHFSNYCFYFFQSSTVPSNLFAHSILLIAFCSHHFTHSI